MPAKANLTKTTDSTANPRALDFVTRFQDSWESLMNILGVTRMIEKVPGTTLKYVKAEVALENSVEEGVEIPYSQATLTEYPITDVTIEKYAKAVSIEEISKNGYDVAIVKTDNAFLNELQKKVKADMFTFYNSGALTAVDTTFQMALAMAKGRCLERFSQLGLQSTDVVAFVNYLDFYTYLGGASFGAQVETAFGMNYVRGYLGYNTIFLCDSSEVPRNTVIATPVENVVAYYVNPGAIDFSAAGLSYVTAGVTPLLGFSVQGNYSTAVSEDYAIMGLYIFAEYIDAICVETIEASGSIGSITLVSAAGTTSGTKLTVTYTLGQGETLYYHSGSSPAVPTYLADMDSSWNVLPALSSGVLDNFAAGGAKIVVAAFNGAGQAVATSTATTVTNHA